MRNWSEFHQAIFAHVETPDAGHLIVEAVARYREERRS